MEIKKDRQIEGLVAWITQANLQRESLLKAASIARSMLARESDAGRSALLRKAAEAAKSLADEQGAKMVRAAEQIAVAMEIAKDVKNPS